MVSAPVVIETDDKEGASALKEVHGATSTLAVTKHNVDEDTKTECDEAASHSFTQQLREANDRVATLVLAGRPEHAISEARRIACSLRSRAPSPWPVLLGRR